MAAKKSISPPVGHVGDESERAKALATALASIEKAHGKGAVIKMGEKPPRDVPVVSTGLLSVDLILGIGGIPKGRIIEVYGPESSGKTTIALQIVAQVQKAGGIGGYIDAEHALDPIYAKKLGINIDELYVSQPDNGEQALDICESMVRSGAIDIVVVDSVAALVPKAEIEGEMGQSHMGVQARLMSQALRKLAGFINKNDCAVIFINQLRDKIGGYGGGETTSGGRALKFYASVRIDVRKADLIKVGTAVTGSRVKIKIAKNKLAPPFKTCEMDIMYGLGISREGDILDLGVEEKIVHKGGAWFSYDDTRLGQGRENAKNFLVANPHICREIENKVRANNDMPLLEEIEPPKDGINEVEELPLETIVEADFSADED